MHYRPTNLIIISYHLKIIYTEADHTRLEYYPTPWKKLYKWSFYGYWYNYHITTWERDLDSESYHAGAFDIHGEIEKIDAQEALAMLGEVTQLDRPPQFI